MKCKKICVFISMFIILFLIVIAPTIFHQFNDERLLNKVYIEDLEHENRPIEKSNLKLEEKIDFLSKYNKDSHIVSSSHREVLNDENKTMLNKNLLREIKSLQTLKVIPDINITMLARMILFKSSLTSFIRGMNSFKFFFIFIPP